MGKERVAAGSDALGCMCVTPPSPLHAHTRTASRLLQSAGQGSPHHYTPTPSLTRRLNSGVYRTVRAQEAATMRRTPAVGREADA